MELKSSKLANLSVDERKELIIKLKNKKHAKLGDSMLRKGASKAEFQLSDAQKRMWFAEQIGGKSQAYNIVSAIQLDGTINYVALESSLNEIVKRHEVLRTCFYEKEGKPVQKVHDFRAIEINVEELTGLSEEEVEIKKQDVVISAFQHKFDLKSGDLFKIRLLKLCDERHILVSLMHHIIADGWSLEVMEAELTNIYGAFVRGEKANISTLPVQYRDYIYWNEQRLQDGLDEKQLVYWKNTLAGAPECLDLPLDFKRKSERTFEGSSKHFSLSSALVDSLRHLSKKSEASLFMVLMASFQILLSRLSGQKDICVGTPSANRASPELEKLIGLFSNTLVVRSKIDKTVSFDEFLMQVKGTMLRAFSYQDVPFERVVDTLAPKRSLAFSPLFQVLFVMQNVSQKGLSLDGLKVKQLEIPRISSEFDLMLECFDTPIGFNGVLTYSSELFTPSSIDSILESFKCLLENVAKNPKLKISEISCISTQDANKHVAFLSDEGQELKDSSLLTSFTRRTSATPEVIIVSDKHQEMSFKSLNEKSNQLAHYLWEHLTENEAVVGVATSNSANFLVSLLAAAKAGKTIVPLNHDAPESFKRSILAKHKIALILSDNSASFIDDDSASTLQVDSDCKGLERYSTVAPDIACDLEHVIYRSPYLNVANGLTQKNLLHYIDYMQTNYPIDDGDVCLSLNAIDEAHTIADIFWYLSYARKLCLFDSLDAESMKRADTASISVVRLTDRYQSLLQDFANTKYIFSSADTYAQDTNGKSGGELCRLQYLPGSLLPIAESRVKRTDVTDVQKSPLRLNKAIARVLDENKQALAFGMKGEIYIKQHAAWMFDTKANQEKQHNVLCKTGIHARESYDGEIVFDYTTQSCTQLQGRDVDLTYIKRLVDQKLSVSNTLVVARETQNKGTKIVVYICVDKDISLSSLRKYLNACLPGFMQPNGYAIVPFIPLDQEGNIDKLTLEQVYVDDEQVLSVYEKMLSSEEGIKEVSGVLLEEEARQSILKISNIIPGNVLETLRQRKSKVVETELSENALLSDENQAHAPSLYEGENIWKNESRYQVLGDILQDVSRERAEQKIVCIEENGKQSEFDYKTLYSYALMYLAALHAHGVSKQDKVIFQFASKREFIIAFWACNLGGIVPVLAPPVKQDGSGTSLISQLLHALELLQYPLILTDDYLLPALQNIAKEQSTLKGQNAIQVSRIDVLQLDEKAEQNRQVKKDDLALLVLTSGSTGKPKAVMLNHENLIKRTEGAVHLNLFTSDDVSLNWMPLDHVGGVILSHIRDSYLGSTQVHVAARHIIEDPVLWIKLLDQYRVSNSWAPNFAFGLVAAQEEALQGESFDLSCVKYLINAGEAVVAKTARKFLAVLAPHKLSGDCIYPAYGMSETSSSITYSAQFNLQSTSDLDTRISVGKAIPGVNLRIVDANNIVLPKGKVGRLQVSGKTIMSGYYNDPERTSESFTQDGWLVTGDLGILNEDGLTITGREKEILILNGVNISSHEIEAPIENLDGVRPSFTAACAFHETDDNTDKLLIFFVPEASAKAKQADLVENIRFNVQKNFAVAPAHIIPLEENQVEKTSLGKIKRKTLVEQFETGIFDHIIYALNPTYSRRDTLPDWFYRKSWKRKNSMSRAPSEIEGDLVIFTDEEGLGKKLSQRFSQKSNVQVIEVTKGPVFKKINPFSYQVNPGEQGDYKALFNALVQDGYHCAYIIHLWTYGAYVGDANMERGLDFLMTPGLYSVFSIFHAINSIKQDLDKVKFSLVSSRSQEISKENMDVEKGALHGFLKTAAQEFSWLQYCHIDFVNEEWQELQATQVVEEVSNWQGDELVSYREDKRWISCLDKCEFSRPKMTAPVVIRGGTYVLAGGLGGIGMQVAKFLLSNFHVKLLIVGRSDLAGGTELSSSAHQKFANLQLLKSLDGEVEYRRVDICQPDQLKLAVIDIEQKWKTNIDGVFNLAGVYQEKMIEQESLESLRQSLLAKVCGSWALHHIFDDREKLIFVHFSSVNGYFGGHGVSGYASANSFLDSLCALENAKGRHQSYCLSWSMWHKLGMSEGFENEDLAIKRGYKLISIENGLHSMMAALHQGHGSYIIGLDETRRFIRSQMKSFKENSKRVSFFYTMADEGATFSHAVDLRDSFDTQVKADLISLEEMPRDSNGLVSKERLALYDEERKNVSQDNADAQNEVEHALLEIWKQVLGNEDINALDNFFQLGGDSILCTQVVARANTRGIAISPKQLFENQTVRDLASVAKIKLVEAIDQSAVEGEVKLSPIQKWFFNRDFKYPNQWNQSALLNVASDINVKVLEKALLALVNHHDMLRSRFFVGETGTMCQELLPLRETLTLEIFSLGVMTKEDRQIFLNEKIAQVQASLDLRTGQVIRPALIRFEEKDQALLFLAVHHLVVDGVSWRILLEDLNSLYSQLLSRDSYSLPAKTHSYKHWAESLASEEQMRAFIQDLEYWKNVSSTRFELPVEGRGKHKKLSECSIEGGLTSEETYLLLREVSHAYNTQINDILLTALTLTLSQWIGSREILISLEGHGREELVKKTDISRTVGWFTSIFPVKLSLPESDDLGNCIKSIKEQLAGIPSKGFSYGALKYLSNHLDEQSIKPELSFNYLGQFNNSDSDAYLSLAKDQVCAPQHEEEYRVNIIDIVGIVIDGQMKFSWIFSKDSFGQDIISHISQLFIEKLKAIIKHCCLVDSKGFTPSDFPLTNFSQRTLDQLLSGLEEKGIGVQDIEDILPLTSTQLGMLYHSYVAPASGIYVSHLVNQIRGSISSDIFRQAWQKTVQKYEMYRTVFVGLDSEQPAQVVVRNAEVEVSELDWTALTKEAQEKSFAKLVSQDRERGFDFTKAPLMRIYLVKIGDRVHRMLMSEHHALSDGWSRVLVLNDVFRSYDALSRRSDVSLGKAIPFSRYLHWLEKQDTKAAERFWKEYLQGMKKACKLSIGKPASGEFSQARPKVIEHKLSKDLSDILRKYVSNNQLTMNIVVQGAWAILLSHYAKTKDIVFGITTSNRPFDLKNVEQIVGPFLNTLPFRVSIDKESRLIDWLKVVQSNQISLSQYSHTPLRDIQKVSEFSAQDAIFESLIIFENFPDVREHDKSSEIEMEWSSSEDHTETPLVLMVSPEEQIRFSLSYSESALVKEWVRPFLDDYERILSTVCQHENPLCGDIFLGLNNKIAKVILPCAPVRASNSGENDFVYLFETQALSSATEIALCSDDREVSYSELNSKANQLARYLKANGCRIGDEVGVCLAGSTSDALSLLACYKLGAIFVPIRTPGSQSNTAKIISKSNITHVINNAGIDQSLHDNSVCEISLLSDWEQIDKESDDNLAENISCDLAAYRIYDMKKDGSFKTTTRQYLSNLSVLDDQLSLDNSSRFLQCDSLDDDGAIWQLFLALANGAETHFSSKNLFSDEIALARFIANKGLTHAVVPPAMLANLTEADLEGMTCIISSTEALRISQRDENVSANEAFDKTKKIEAILLDIWCRLLNKTIISVYDNFFDLGGDSIQTIQVISRAREKGVVLTPHDIYLNPSINELSRVASYVKNENSESGITLSNRVPGAFVDFSPEDFPYIDVSVDDLDDFLDSVEEAFGLDNLENIYPVTALQPGFLYASSQEETKEFSVTQLTFELSGNVDPVKVRRSWQQSANRFESLRTAFIKKNASIFYQVTVRNIDLPWKEYQLDRLEGETYEEKLSSVLKLERRDGFDCAQAPLIKIALVSVSEKECWLAVTYHHAILDGWSLPILLEDVFNNYHQRNNNILLEDKRITNESYIRWMVSQNTEKAKNYWSSYLAGYSQPTVLHIDRNRENEVNDVGEASLTIGEALTRKLAAVARQHRVTLNVLFQSAFAICLKRFSGSDDIVFGTVVSGRPGSLVGVDALVGMFINTIPLRVKFSATESAAQLLSRLNEERLEHENNSYLPLPDIIAQSEISGNQSLFDAIFAFENYPIDVTLATVVDESEFTADMIDFREQGDFKLALTIIPSDSIDLHLRYGRGRYSDEAMEAFLKHLHSIIENIATDVHKKVSELQVYTGQELEALLDQSRGKFSLFEEYETIGQIFKKRVQENPDSPAVVFGDDQLSYAELDEKSNQLAHYFIEQGIQLEDYIAVGLNRSIELIVTILAVMKSGATYVPIDPNYPQDRKEYMISTVGVALLITEAELDAFDFTDVPKRCIKSIWEGLKCNSKEAPSVNISSSNLAYVIFTSGSTGLPKASQVCQSGLCNTIQAQVEKFGIEVGHRMGQVISTSFDVSVQEIFITLCSGAALYIVPHETLIDTERFCELLIREKISAIHLPNALLDALSSRALPDLKVVITGGEPISAKTVSTYGVEKRLFNEYGMTEASLAICSHWCQTIEDNPPIGLPYDNTQILILDNEMNLVPKGATGEIYIGGIGVSRGYHRMAALTAEKFIPNPYSFAKGERLYKTGDLASYDEQGCIRISGREDHQVKVRGHRIELTEIENTIASYDGINSAVAVVREDREGQKRIASYIVLDDNTSSLNLIGLKAWLRSKLPQYMQPSSLNILDAFPLTLSGKVDRKNMPRPDWDANGESLDLLNLDYIQNTILDIISEVVGISVHQSQLEANFFDLGGDSLLATQVITRVNEVFSTNLKVNALFETDTIQELVALVAEEEEQVASSSDVDDLFSQLEGLSEEDVKKMLEEN